MEEKMIVPESTAFPVAVYLAIRTTVCGRRRWWKAELNHRRENETEKIKI